jgi:hypothetical protein
VCSCFLPHPLAHLGDACMHFADGSQIPLRWWNSNRNRDTCAAEWS